MKLFQMVESAVPVAEIQAALANGLSLNPGEVVSFFLSARVAFHYYAEVFELPEVQQAWRMGGGEVRFASTTSSALSHDKAAPPSPAPTSTGAKGAIHG